MSHHGSIILFLMFGTYDWRSSNLCSLYFVAQMHIAKGVKALLNAGDNFVAVLA